MINIRSKAKPKTKPKRKAAKKPAGSPARSKATDSGDGLTQEDIAEIRLFSRLIAKNNARYR